MAAAGLRRRARAFANLHMCMSAQSRLQIGMCLSAQSGRMRAWGRAVPSVHNPATASRQAAATGW
jgi:hypothetical protein